MTTSFWGCVEVDAISRNFDYEKYLSFHEKTGCVSQAVYLEVYQILSDAFHKQMELDVSFHPDPLDKDVDTM